MANQERWFRRLNAYVVSSEPNEHGEWRAFCPLHENPSTSESPSATINFEKGVYHCNAGCGGGGIRSLIAAMDRGNKEDTEEAAYNPFDDDVIVSFEDAKARKRGEQRAPLSEGLIKGWHKTLMASPDALEALIQKRGLTKATIEKYSIGYEIRSQRYTIPIRDEHGMLVNVRRYKPDAEKSQKMANLLGHGSPPRLFPFHVLQEADTILVVEGELDALLCNQNGVPAVSGTGGAMRWTWSKEFTGKDVAISYDNDKEGRVGAKKVARSLHSSAARVRIMDALLPDQEKSDVTDWFMAGGTGEQLRERIATTPDTPAAEQPKMVSAEAVPVQVIGSMDSRTNGRALSMAVTITGKKNPTYSVPARAELSCTMDAGPKCKVCPMAEAEGEQTVDIERNDVTTIARFIDASEDKTVDLLRRVVGAVKCNRFTAEVIESHTVEEIFVTGSVDRRSIDGHDYTQRRVYNVSASGGDTPTNTTANVVGTTWPSPKDRRNEFFSWELAEATTSIDTFKMAPELVERLSIFQPKEGQSPIEKAHEIAVDLSSNVTKIIGRERLHMAMDLVYHSVMHFELDGKVISRGWLEFIVVGDTRTGKSETAIRLADHYGLGHVIGCEGATFAGLVGAVKQVGDAWTVQWGEITINDRRLVVLDEASGLSQDIIGQLSDIRSRGIAQLTKVESQETRARCRMIWISNPRKSKFVDEKKVDGIDILEDLIGNPEDIARFDFAMSVRMDDVPSEKINRPDREHVPHVYTSDLCRDLVLWAWSRKPEHVEWKPDAYNAVYTGAEWLGKRYVDHPPLIQRTNVREKIARLAVALAARTFSTDETGERLVVEYVHVKDATEFLDKLYRYDNFGYHRLSKRIARNRAIAKKNRARIKKWLTENPRLLEFLLDRRGSFRAQDLEEMAYMQRDEVSHVLSTLSDAKMISKEKSQIIIEPELHRLLKEMEK